MLDWLPSADLHALVVGAIASAMYIGGVFLLEAWKRRAPSRLRELRADGRIKGHRRKLAREALAERRRLLFGSHVKRGSYFFDGYYEYVNLDFDDIPWQLRVYAIFRFLYTKRVIPDLIHQWAKRRFGTVVRDF